MDDGQVEEEDSDENMDDKLACAAAIPASLNRFVDVDADGDDAVRCIDCRWV